MTLLVGIACTDGVVIAADSWASYGTPAGMTLGGQVVKKVVKVNDRMLLATSGGLGTGQSVLHLLKSPNPSPLYPPGTRDPLEAKAKLEERLAPVLFKKMQAGTSVRAVDPMALANSQCAALIGVALGQSVFLMSVDPIGNIELSTEQLPFVALGSGQALADPFLGFIKRVIWNDVAPNVAGGTLAAVWTVQHVANTNGPGVGVGGTPLVGVLRTDGTNITMEWPDVEEHLQAVADLEAAIRGAATTPRRPAEAEPRPPQEPSPPRT